MIPTPPSGTQHRIAAAVTVCLGLFLLGLDLTVLNVAIPDLQKSLHASTAEVQWIVDGYALVLGGTVLATGALTDRIGRRRAFCLGLAVCGAASLSGALAREPAQIIAARGGMGAGAALMMPATLSVLVNLFPEPDLRRRAIAMWAVAVGAGGALGPVVGGRLVQDFSWRAGFWINPAVAAVVIILARLVVPESRPSQPGRFDLPGTLLSAAGLTTLVWAIIEAPSRGWTSATVLAAAATALLLMTFFVLGQARNPAPMLPLELLRRPLVSGAATALALVSFALFGALFVITLYLQGPLGYTPWQAGTRTLPLPLALTVGAAAAVTVARRHGEKTAIVTGLLTVTTAFVILAATRTDSRYPHLVLFQAVGGCGAGLVAAAGTETVMNAVGADRAGIGSALNDATRQVGSALGIAVQGSLMANIYSTRLHRASLPDVPPELLHRIDGSFLAARNQTAELPQAVRAQLAHASKAAFVHAMTVTATTAAAVTLAAAAATYYWLPPTRPARARQQPALAEPNTLDDHDADAAVRHPLRQDPLPEA